MGRTGNDRIASSAMAKQRLDDTKSRQIDRSCSSKRQPSICRLGLTASFLDRTVNFMPERSSHGGWASHFNQELPSRQRMRLLTSVRAAYGDLR